MAHRGEGDGETEFTLLSRSELEARVRERTAYLENLMDTMADVLLVLDAEGRVEMANDALAEVLGYDQDDVVGKPVDAMFAEEGAVDGHAFVERLLAEGQVTDLELSFSTSDGETVPTSVSGSLMKDDGAATGIVCVAKDISERKAAEEHSEFLHSLLRHDLGNKLQVTSGYLELMQEGEVPVEEYVDTALDSLRDASELIEDVRTLHRLEVEQDPEPVPLDDVVADAVDRHRDLVEQTDVAVENTVDGGHLVLAGPLLKEAFSNLVENAIVHSGGSHVEVSAGPNDGEVVVAVVDDGDGISDDRMDRIFEKGVAGSDSSGSGLGTYLVDRIVTAYGGDVTVTDAESGGARFDVTLRQAR